MGHSCGTLLWDTLVCHSRGTLLRGTPKVSKSQPSRLQNERFVRDFLKNAHFDQNSRINPPKRSVRDCLQKSRVQVSNTSISYETSSHAGSPIGAHTHIKQPCQAVSRLHPLETMPAHMPIPMPRRHSPPPQLATSRFPAPATKICTSTRPTRTKYCACHEM